MPPSQTSLILFCILFFGKCSATFRLAGPEEVVGNLTIRFLSFANPNHLISTGAGCDLGWFGSKECDPRFTFCFLNTETSWNSNNSESVNKCDFAGPFHCGPYDNAGVVKFADVFCNYQNPMVLNITKAWLGVEMRVRVDEMERGSFLGSNTAVGPLIDNFSYFFNARPALDNVMKLKLLGFTKANTTLVVEAQIRCLPNFYDVKCSKFCLASARYDCDPRTGAIICKTGWSGENCTARSVSDQLTIHPLSFGSQVDEMIVYEVQVPAETENVTSLITGDLEVTVAAVALESSGGSTIASTELTETDIQPHFDKQSSENKSSHLETPAPANNGVASVRSTTLSSIWPLTVSLVVGGISVYATTSSPSPSANVTKLPTSPDLENVPGNTTEQTSTVVVVQPLTVPTVQSARESNPEATESVNSQEFSTTDVTATSVGSSAQATTTNIIAKSENFTVGETSTPTVVSLTSIILPNFDWSQLTSQANEEMTSVPENSTAATATSTKLYVSLNKTAGTESPKWKTTDDELTNSTETNLLMQTTIAALVEEAMVEAVEIKPLLFTVAEIDSTSTFSPTTSNDFSTTVLLNNISTVAGSDKNLSAAETRLPVNATIVSHTRKVDMVAMEDEILLDKTTLSTLNSTSEPAQVNSTNLTEEIIYNTSDSSTEASSTRFQLQNTTNFMDFIPTENATAKDVVAVSNVSVSFSTNAPSVISTTLTQPVVDNAVVINSNKTAENVSGQEQKVRFRTFPLHAGLRFPEPLTNVGLLDQLNSSVYDATETLLKKDNVSGEHFPNGLKTAVEFTGISINSSAVVPQITLYATLNGKPVLSDLEFGMVLEEAIINLRQNATVSGINYSIGNAAYASNHPVMVFLIAMLSVAIVVLIGIIMVLMRKPKARRCQTVGPLSDQLDLSSSFDSFSSTSAYDNLAFSEPRLHFISDDEIVSLEPSVNNHAQTAQERLFARRTVVHSIGSPVAVPRIPADVNRTITTFKKPTGNTI